MSRPERMRQRRWLAPEVVQTSAMDCGPASLKCLLEGFGVHASYGRLREACQTDVDGTSIDTMESIAVQLGLEAEQVMVPADHVLLPEARLLPAIAVVRLANGVTHFVVIWRRHGPVVQLMDPATGRRWTSGSRLLEMLYLHRTAVPEAAWLEWSGSAGLLAPLGRRLADLGAGRSLRARLVASALEQGGWRPIAALDAATRMIGTLVRSGGLPHGRPALRVLEAFFERDSVELPAQEQGIPDGYWSVRPAPAGPDGEAQLLLSGAVLVHVGGRRAAPDRAAAGSAAAAAEPAAAALSPELVRALDEAPSRPGRTLLRTLRADGLLAPAALLAAFAASAAGVMFAVLLLRGLLDVGRELELGGQRLGAMSALFLLILSLLLLELPILEGLQRLGRHLEIRLRIAFLEKIPRLGDRYFQSRLISDMAERSHGLHRVRQVTELGGQFVRLVLILVLTTAGIVWLDPETLVPAAGAAVLAVLLPLGLQPLLRERDMRVRTHGAALSRFYFDALMGLMAIRAHAAEAAVRREHEGLLVEWSRASLGLQRIAVLLDALQALCGFGLAAGLLVGHLRRGGGSGSVLLLVYWALNLPSLGQQLAVLVRQAPAVRNTVLRLLEPLGAPDEDTQSAAPARRRAEAPPRRAQAGGQRESEGARTPARQRGGEETALSVELRGVHVVAAGHAILQDVDLAVEAGSHVAIVGPSGAGKSSLVGLLLGWHRPARGEILVDGAPLDGARLASLRRQCAWVDPAVQLWNRSFLENLRYGAATEAGAAPEQAAETPALAEVIDAAALRGVLEKLPEGLQTSLGEGGALVSGGEGQRVRLGRAMLRPGVRLVILDEPFRGLDRERRRELLAQSRQTWKQRTLLCVTHDVGETLSFERVLVIEGGRLVEDGVPAVLAQKAGTRYRALLEAEEAVRRGLWADEVWTRLWLEDGRLETRR